MVQLPRVLLAPFVLSAAFGQIYTISTVAGGGLPVNIPGVSASLYGPRNVAVDASGNVFFTSGNSVLRWDALSNIVTLVAGNGTWGFSGDNGPATSAQLAEPEGIAVDSAGNLYIADEGNELVRKVSNGEITTVAGGGVDDSVGDNGPATNAVLDPEAVAVDSAGDFYIADYSGQRVRKVSNGVITTIAGTGTAGFSGDNGPAISAHLSGPTGIALDEAGNLYIADAGNLRVRKVTNGTITTVAGGGGAFPGDNGPATSALLNDPAKISTDSAGNLYFTDAHGVRKVANGIITTIASDQPGGFSADGIAADSAGNLYVADSDNSLIRRISNGIITTIAGNGTSSFSGDGGPATDAQLSNPTGITVDSAGNIFIADNYNCRIRKVSNGVITTIAGVGTQGFSGDGGPAIDAQLSVPSRVAVDSAGNVYVVEEDEYQGYGRIRKISNGLITTVAGGGAAPYCTSGPATNAEIVPGGIAVDSSGNLYLADNGCVLEVSNGGATSVAGNGIPGFSGVTLLWMLVAISTLPATNVSGKFRRA